MIDIDPNMIPDEGLAIEGVITDDIFGLPEGDARPVGPVRYSARAYRIEGELVVEGEFAADFELECVRCTEKFVYAVRLSGHNLAENVENPEEPDLTAALREDILLALPVYPRCEEGKIARRCPAQGRFDPPAAAAADGGEAGAGQQPPTDDDEPNPWAELDNWRRKSSNGDSPD